MHVHGVSSRGNVSYANGCVSDKWFTCSIRSINFSDCHREGAVWSYACKAEVVRKWTVSAKNIKKSRCCAQLGLDFHSICGRGIINTQAGAFAVVSHLWSPFQLPQFAKMVAKAVTERPPPNSSI